MSFKISVLGSSSSGNCTFISTNKTKILLDAGFSRKQIAKRLATIGESLDGLDAVIISHEHTDHVSGLASLLSEKDLPLFVAERTAEAINPGVTLENAECIQAGRPFVLGDLTISPFSVPHDAVDPLAFTFEAEGIKLAHVTDLGYLTELVLHRLSGSHIIVLEANHDLEMLKLSPYPWAVKQRIMSRQGHLSNELVGRFIDERFDGQAQYLVLAHLSENNNHPEIARMVAAQALEKRGFDCKNLILAGRSSPCPVIEV